MFRSDPISSLSGQSPMLIIPYRYMLMRRSLHVFSLTTTLLVAGSFRADATEIEAGPLFHDFKLTLDSGHRTEALGPFYYDQQLEDDGSVTRSWAVPPLFSYTSNDHVDYEWFDFLWKGITYNRYGSEYRVQLLQLLSFAGGQTQSETNVHRFTLFPFYFQQRSKIPDKNYTALFPIYGTIRGRLFRDEATFALFPAYLQTRKRDVVTDNFLFPIFHLRHGDALSGWQFWPLAGREHKDISWQTNHWGDREMVGGHDKNFVLWPFYLHHHVGIGTTNVSNHHVLIPLYSRYRSEQRDSTSYLWPLGFTYTDDRARRYTEWGAPWPLVVFARGEGKTVNRVWPLYSNARSATQSSGWYLWPLYKYNGLFSPQMERERKRVLFYLYSDTTVKSIETGKSQRLIALWPLLTSRRELDGNKRLQILAPLEPFLPNNTSVERDLSPLWSVWRSERNERKQATSQSLLWNLYRRDTTPNSRKCSLLFGLIQYQSGSDGRRWRVGYIPFGKKKSATEASPK